MTDKHFFQLKSMDVFLISPQKHVVGTHLKYLWEALLMSTHNLFLWRNMKNKKNLDTPLIWSYGLLSSAEG